LAFYRSDPKNKKQEGYRGICQGVDKEDKGKSAGLATPKADKKGLTMVSGTGWGRVTAEKWNGGGDEVVMPPKASKSQLGGKKGKKDGGNSTGGGGRNNRNNVPEKGEPCPSGGKKSPKPGGGPKFRKS